MDETDSRAASGPFSESFSGSFSGMLRELRHEAGLSQEELAELAGLSTRTVSNLERCQNGRPYRHSLERLATALRLDGQVRDGFVAAGRGQAVAPAGGEAAGLTGLIAAPAEEPGADHRPGAAAVVRTLPRDIGSFTGRQHELGGLGRALDGAGAGAEIQAIAGMAGVGKTAFAVHAAHLLAPRFPDGQLFLRLHGHTPGHRPAGPADALASLLVTTGLDPARIPAGLEERAALWRHHMAGRRALLIFDDAIGSEQVRPLLPGTAGSLVLVTGRRRLTALDDAQVINLDVLPGAESAALFTRLAGRPGLDAGEAVVAEICRLCGCLPLAIGMVARQLQHHPAWIPAELAADLGASRDRLELMSTENTSVAAGFDQSYAGLTHDQQRLFRRLSLHPGSDIDAHAAAALDDRSPDVARRHLAALYEHCLLSESAPGRYRLHDLIREHARALAARDDPASDRDQALGRLLDYYAHTAAPAEPRRRDRPAAAGRALDRRHRPPHHTRSGRAATR